MINVKTQQNLIIDCLATCKKELTQLQKIVLQQKWESLAPHVKIYQENITILNNILSSKSPPEGLSDKLFKLSNQQRRIMRSLHNHMQQTSDDIKSIDKGISRLKHISEHQNLSN